MVTSLLNSFWDESFWLPEGITWSQMESRDENFAKAGDLFWVIPISVAMLVIRFSLERHVLKPFGIFLKVDNKKSKQPQPNQELERIFKQKKTSTLQEIDEISKKLDIEHRTVERWLRDRKLQDRPTQLDKFCESGWKFLYYFTIFTFALKVHWNLDYFWDIHECAKNNPYHSLPNGIWYYYMISMGFYASSTITHFYDTKRKDFWVMFLHHLVTLTMMTFSWTAHCHRIGSLILILHDIADIVFELGKCTAYAKYEKAKSFMFIIFVFVWFETRMDIYLRIVYFTCVESFQLLEKTSPAQNVMRTLTAVLLALNTYWSILIVKAAFKTITKRETLSDTRSESEDQSE